MIPLITTVLSLLSRLFEAIQCKSRCCNNCVCFQMVRSISRRMTISDQCMVLLIRYLTLPIGWANLQLCTFSDRTIQLYLLLLLVLDPMC